MSCATQSPSQQIINSPQHSVHFPSLPAECSTRHQRRPSVSSDSDHSVADDKTSSEDDEEGVFFGSHVAREAVLLERLATSSTSLTPPLEVPKPAQTRRSLRKRDSREFLRRKTLLLSVKGNELDQSSPTNDKEKVWDGGFYEKGIERPRTVEDESDDDIETPGKSSIAVHDTPSKPQPTEDHCDLTLDFSRFRLSDLAPPPLPRSAMGLHVEKSSEEEDESTVEESEDDDSDESETEDESFDGDSDKENNAVPMSPISSDDQPNETGDVRDALPIILGFRYEEAAVESDNDDLEELDMGGLKLTDFEDPDYSDENRLQRSTSVPIDFGSDGRVEADSDSDDGQVPESPTIMIGNVVALVDRSATFHATAELPDSGLTSESVAVAEDRKSDASDESPEMLLVGDGLQESLTETPSATISSETTPIRMIMQESPTPRTSSPRMSASSSTCGADSSLLSDELDSPIPTMRGGPVIIPQLSHLAYSIRAETESPFRDLPSDSSPSLAGLEIEADSNATVHLASLDSPTRVLVLSSHSTPPTVPSHAVPASTGNARTPAAKQPMVEGTGLGAATKSKLLKSSLTSSALISASVDRPKHVVSTTIDKKTAARAANIRSQLDSAFAPRQNVMGPPQRTASASSSTSSSSASGPSRPTNRPGVGGPSRPKPISADSARPGARKPSASVSHAGPSVQGSGKSYAGRVERPPAMKSSQSTARPTGMSSTMATNRPTTSGAPPRQPLIPRSIPVATARPAVARTGLTQPFKKAIPLAAVKNASKPIENVSPPRITTANPLKRPLASSQPGLARSMVSTGPVGGRQTFGPPARVVSLGSAPVFSIGTGGGDHLGASRGFRSPGRMGAAKRTGGSPAVSRKLGTPTRLGTPSQCGVSRQGYLGTPSRNGIRGLGTPSRSGLFSRPQVANVTLAPAPTSIQREATSLQAESSDTSPPVDSGGATTTATETTSTTRAGTPIRGSSADQEDVSFQLAPASSSDQGSSPLSKATSRLPRPVSSQESKDGKDSKEGSPENVIVTFHSDRPKRATATKAPSSRGLSGTTAPNMSEKELKATTERNTSRNEVYHCAIDRQIVRKNGPRPPSPSSKIRTVADRDQAEKKAGRGERAKRRSRGSDTESTAEEPPRIERITLPRGPGEEEDYVTPARPVKRSKTTHGEKEKNVKWDRGLLVHREDGELPSKEVTPSVAGYPTRSALKPTPVELDGHGNVVGAHPGENLKRQRIVVTAVFYEGEEPLPVPAYASTIPASNRSTSKAKKK